MSKRKRPRAEPVPEKAKSKNTERLGALIFDVILALVPAVATTTVVTRWVIWAVSVPVFVYLVQPLFPKQSESSRRRRILVTTGLSVVFAVAAWPLVRSQWREEKAAALEGDLIGAGPVVDDGKPHGFPMLQTGETTFIMTPDGVRDIFPFFPDSGVRIEWGARGWPLLTTTVRDHNENLVAEVIRNHWRVYPAYSAERNYTNDTLEVQDEAGHVVLQVRILRDRILLLGEWWDVQGNGVRIMKPAVVTPSDGSRVVRMNPQNQHLDELIQPIFEYPSKDHWGELRKQ
jgi:hypothetical protein